MLLAPAPAGTAGAVLEGCTAEMGLCFQPALPSILQHPTPSIRMPTDTEAFCVAQFNSSNFPVLLTKLLRLLWTSQGSLSARLEQESPETLSWEDSPFPLQWWCPWPYWRIATKVISRLPKEINRTLHYNMPLTLRSIPQFQGKLRS